MNDLDWMPFYGVAFFTSESVLALDASSERLYLRMLWLQYARGGCPDDARVVARLTGLDVSEALEAWDSVTPLFERRSDGRLYNTVCAALYERHVEARRSKAEAARANGSKGGRPKKTHEEPTKNPVGYSQVSSSEAESDNPVGSAGLCLGYGGFSDSGEDEASESQVEQTSIIDVSTFVAEPCADPKPTANPEETQTVTHAKPTGLQSKEIRVSTSSKEEEAPVSTQTAYEQVEALLIRVSQILGAGDPLPRDVRRHLRADSSVRTLIRLFGIEEAAAMYVFTVSAWKGRTSWDAVCDKRDLIRADMGTTRLHVASDDARPTRTGIAQIGASLAQIGPGGDA